VTGYTPRDTPGCIIAVDSPVLPILPGRVLLLERSCGTATKHAGVYGVRPTERDMSFTSFGWILGLAVITHLVDARREVDHVCALAAVEDVPRSVVRLAGRTPARLAVATSGQDEDDGSCSLPSRA
jgi:hypothetical protein